MSNPHSKSEQELTFEQAFQRLESILETLNSSHPTLEESVSLFTEADTLIVFCNKQLVDAERKIEMLVKNRAGNLELNAEGQPQTKPFSPHTT